MNKKNLFLAAVALSASTQLGAATFITVSSQTADANPSAGYAFLFNAKTGSAQSVDSLAVYVPAGSASGETLVVSLWNASGVIATSTFSPLTANSGDGFAYSAPSVPVTLVPGAKYALTVSGYTSSLVGYAFGSPFVTPSFNAAIGTAPYDISGFTGFNSNPVLAGFPNANSPAQFTFASLATSPVPEPETYAMMAGLGLLGFGLYRRQVRK